MTDQATTNPLPTGLDILNDWRTIRIQWKTQANDLLEILAAECRDWFALGIKDWRDSANTKLAQRHGENLQQFMQDLPPVWRPFFWQLLATKRERHQMEFIISANKYLAPAVCSAFGVPVGEKGKGVVPVHPITGKKDLELDSLNGFYAARRAG